MLFKGVKQMNTIEPDKMVDFGQLIAQPIMATMDAEVSAAENFVKFIEEYGLEEKTRGTAENGEKTTQLKMLSFGYSQRNPRTGELENYRVQVPLLSIIPLPLLQIDYAEFDFNIRLFTQVEYENHPGGQKGSLIKEKDKESEQPKIQEAGKFKGFQARLSATTGQKEDGKTSQSLDANMKMKIKMKQADLPTGLIKLMTVFENSTSVGLEENYYQKTQEIEATSSENKQ